MGKASKWFRGLLGLRRPDSPSTTAASAPKPPKEKRRWSFVNSYREKKDNHHHHRHASADPSGHVEGPDDSDKHAMAVAAATAAVAQAAVARLRVGGRSAIVREEWAAIKIQAAFRGCLVGIIVAVHFIPFYSYSSFLPLALNHELEISITKTTLVSFFLFYYYYYYFGGNRCLSLIRI